MELWSKRKKEGQHPAAHIHLGVDSPIRLSCKYKLKPMSFILFVLRQFYPDEWTRLLTYGENIPEVNVALKSVRDNLEPYIHRLPKRMESS